MKVYIAGEQGAKERKVRDIVKLETPQGHEGYLYHGLVLYDGTLVVVGSMDQDAPFWCDLNIPMGRAMELLENKKGHVMEQQERITAMASIMVKARQNNEDVGELIAASLQSASEELLWDVEGLVRGRPGSWEADIVRRMAQAGGTANKERIAELAPLFIAMGDAGVDGGDELSQAMSQAVDTLGGLDAFAGMSQWYHDLINIGCQYSSHAFTSASVYNLNNIDDGGKA